MNLRTLFAIPIAVILFVTLSLAGMVTSQGLVGHARGKAAILAVDRMRLMVLLQTDLWAERVASYGAFAEPFPLPDSAARTLAGVRHETDLRIQTLIADFNPEDRPGTTLPAPFIRAVMVKLGMVRYSIDALLARDRSERTFQEVSSAVARIYDAAGELDRPLVSIGFDVTAAEPDLSGILTVERLATMSKDGLGRIPRLLLPRFSTGQQLTAADVEGVHVLLAQQTQLAVLLTDTFEAAAPTKQMRNLLADLNTFDSDDLRQQISLLLDNGALKVLGEPGVIWMQRLIVPWSERVNALRLVIMDAAVAHVAVENDARVEQLNIALVAFGAVLFATLESVALLHWRVVGPLAQLGSAITRIAAGDRATPLIMRSGTRELADMVIAVETLRRAALIADATAMRQREVAERRLLALRDVLAILQTVQEPAHALERGVASLSEGIDAAIALVTTPNATLGAAADAVRVGLEEMRDATADLDATIAAARTAQTDERPEAEIVAHILAVQGHVARRDEAVRGFLQPSLVALRDVASTGGGAPVLRDLIRVQFQCIETAVAMVASTRASVAQAADIVRDLRSDDTPLAA